MGIGRIQLQRVIFLGPAALYALAFMILPYLNVFQFSFWKVENYAVVPQFNVENYQRILTSDLYLPVIGNSLRIAAIVTVSAVCLGYCLAFYVAFFAGNARRWLYFLIVIPLLTSFLLRAFIWRLDPRSRRCHQRRAHGFRHH